MRHTINSISWYGVHPIVPDVTYFLYFLMWRLYCSSQMHSISWYGVYTVYPDVAYFLHFLMWRPVYCISWCGVYTLLQRYIAFPDMAYILYFLIRHTFCISWCGAQYIGLLIWRMYCSSDINTISRFGVHPFFLVFVAYFLYFPIRCTLHCVSSYGVYIVLQISVMFPGMSHSLFNLLWLISCISWCGVHNIVAPEMVYILFCRYT